MKLISSKWLLVLCLATAAPAVAGCGMESVQVVNDPFLGPTRGFRLFVDPAGLAGMSVKEAKGEYTFTVMVVEHGSASAVAKVGDPTEFLVGSEVITLPNAVEAQPVSNVWGGSMVITQWQMTFKPTAQQVARFAAAPLNAIKVHVSGQEYQIAVAPAKAAKFQANMVIMTSPPGASPAAVAVTAAPVVTTSAATK
jgi:hypothetical protein